MFTVAEITMSRSVRQTKCTVAEWIVEGFSHRCVSTKGMSTVDRPPPVPGQTSRLLVM